MMRNKRQQWHFWPDFSEMLPQRHFSIHLGSILFEYSLYEYYENMWKSLRKYLSRADAASHFFSISSLRISANPMARKNGDTLLRLLDGAIHHILNGHFLLRGQLWKYKHNTVGEHTWNQKCHCLQCMRVISINLSFIKGNIKWLVRSV